MPASTSPEVRLSVTAGSPLAEILLIDDQFVLVARSVGDLDCRAARGVYKVKAKLGDATSERLVLLEADQRVDLAPELAVTSPVPLEADPAAPPRAAAEATPRRAGAAAGAKGEAELFLMTRSSLPSGDAALLPPAITVHRLDGSLVASLEPGPGARSSTTGVSPGPYLVRRRDRFGEEAEQCVHAVAGWQTQVFTLDTGRSPADLGGTRVSVLMSRQGAAPRYEERRLVEEARTALADKRKIATAAVAALVEQVDNPVLSLIGAHLMLVGSDAASSRDRQRRDGHLGVGDVPAPVQFDQGQYDRIVGRLLTVLGPGHPDVVALATRHSGQNLQDLPAVTAPPMLWRSWVLLVGASNDVPALVPPGIWRQTLHVLPLRPFFLWTPAAGTDVTRRWLVGLTEGLAAARDERTPHGALAELGAAAGAAGGDLDQDQARRRLSETLLVPRVVVDRLAEGEEL